MFSFFRKKDKVKLFYNTEVHCHILPGVDHGAQTVEDSLALIEREMEMGISRFIFTSHVTEATFENTPETLSAAFETLKAAVEQAGLDIEMHYSAEYRLDEYFMKEYEAGHLVTMPGNYLLIENSYQQELLMLDDLIFDLQIKGYRPVLAHPERYPYYGRRHDRYRTLHNAGVKFQVNILSLAGYFGTGAKQSAEWLIDNDFCDMLGSDMHGQQHADIISDYLQTKEWRKIAKKLEGKIMNDKVK